MNDTRCIPKPDIHAASIFPERTRCLMSTAIARVAKPDGEVTCEWCILALEKMRKSTVPATAAAASRYKYKKVTHARQGGRKPKLVPPPPEDFAAEALTDAFSDVFGDKPADELVSATLGDSA